MTKKGAALCLVVFLVCAGISGCSDRKVSAKLIAQVDHSWILESSRVSPDSKRIAYVATAGGKQFVTVDGKEGSEHHWPTNRGSGCLPHCCQGTTARSGTTFLRHILQQD